MANLKHLEILKQGVEVWNRWRANHPKIKPNLSGMTLDGFKEIIGERITIPGLKGVWASKYRADCHRYS